MRHCAVIVLLICISGSAAAQQGTSRPVGDSLHDDVMDAISSLIATPVMETDHLVGILEAASFTMAGYDPYTDSWLWGHRYFGMTKQPDIQGVIDSVADQTRILGQVWFWKLGFRGVSLSFSADESMAGLSAIAVPAAYLPELLHICETGGFRIDSTRTRETADYGTTEGRQMEVKFLLSRDSDDDKIWIWICRDYCLLKYLLSE